VRLTVFSGSGRFIRSAPLPAGTASFRFAVLPDGRIVVNNYGVDRPAFALLDTSLALVREFGPRIGRPAPDPDALQYQLAVGDSGTIVATRVNYSYVVEVWDTLGTLLHRLVRDAAWYAQWTRQDAAQQGPISRPLPRIVSSYYAGEGRLWVAAVVADRNWRPPPLRAARESPAPGALLGAEAPRYLDAVVELLDLRAGRLVLSQRLDDLVFYLGRGLAAGYREDHESGTVQLVVYRLEVTR